MLIKIRVVVEVPDEDEARIPDAIEHITELIKQEFPNLKVHRAQSPIIVSIEIVPDNSKIKPW